MKLTTDDIVVLSEKQQVKNVIISVFGSIDAFSEKVGCYPSASTIRNYLRGTKGLYESFKNLVRKHTNMSYNEIALTPEKQINNWIKSIEDNSKEYNTIEDLEILEAIKDVCNNIGYTGGLGKLHISIGNFYSRLDIVENAFKHYNDAIEIFETRYRDSNYLLKVLYTMANYAYKQERMELVERYYTKAQRTLEDHRSEIDANNFFFFCYYHGIYLMYIKKYEFARMRFNEALENASDLRSKSSALSNIGMTYRKQGEFETSIKYYLEAIAEIGEYYNPTKSSLYNNLAEVMRLSGRLEEATIYIEKAFELISGHDEPERLQNLYDTLLNINIDKGEFSNNIDNLKRILRDCSYHNGRKHYIIDHIKTLIRLAEKRNNFDELYEMVSIIKEKIKIAHTSNDEEFINSLTSCLGEILLIII